MDGGPSPLDRPDPVRTHRDQAAAARAPASAGTTRPSPVLALQRAAGNQAVAQLLAHPGPAPAPSVPLQRTVAPELPPAVYAALTAHDFVGACRLLTSVSSADRRELLAPIAPAVRQQLRNASLQNDPTGATQLAADIEAVESRTSGVAAPAPVDIAALTGSERISRAWDHAKGQLGPATVRELEALITPESLGALALFAVAYVAAQLTPVGWIADGIALTTLTISAFFLGRVVWDVTSDVVQFTSAASATDEAGIHAAGDALARAIARGGTALVVALFSRCIGRTVGPRAPGPPPSAPAPEFVALTPQGLLVGMPAAAVRATAAAQPSLLQGIALMSVATPPGAPGPGPQAGGPSTGPGEGGGASGGGEGAAASGPTAPGPTSGGPYAHLRPGRGMIIRAGRDYSPAQKRAILAANRERNGGRLRSDDPLDPYQDLSEPQRSVSPGMGGQGQDRAMASVDHRVAQSAGGENSYANARVISQFWNNLLRARGAPPAGWTPPAPGAPPVVGRLLSTARPADVVSMVSSPQGRGA